MTQQDDITQRLNEIHADAGYLFGRVAADGACAGAMAESVRARIDAIKALLSKLRAPVADERAAFETAMKNRGQNVDRWPNPHGGYRKSGTEIAWYAWNDSAAVGRVRACCDPTDSELDKLYRETITEGPEDDVRLWENPHRFYARAVLARYAAPASAPVAKSPEFEGIKSAPVAGEAQPAVWVAADTLNSPHPTCVSSLAYMSQLDRERGREYVPLYAAPQASAEDVRNAALEEAAVLVGGHTWAGASQIVSDLIAEHIRALKKPQADKDGGQQRAGDVDERAVLDGVRAALADLLDYVDSNTCIHESTHRGGAIWTICDGCGAKWADDEGGFVPHQDAPAVAAARAALSAPQAEQGERDA